MIYALEIREKFWFCDPSERFAPQFGTPTEKQIFDVCLEDYLQDYEGCSSLPSKRSPWKFYRGETKEEIKGGSVAPLKVLHDGDKDSLWELLGYLRGTCTVVRVMVDY